MKGMLPASTRALTVTAGLILLAGLMVMSPSAAFLAFCLTALVAAPPAFFGGGKMRLLALVLLITAVLLAVGKYPAFRTDQQHYRERVKTAGLPAHPTAIPGDKTPA